MPLEFFRNADDRLLFEAVSGAFAVDRVRHEPETIEARDAAQATISEQGLIQPVDLPGNQSIGISLLEATAIVEAAGKYQTNFPLTESIVLATAFAADGRTLDAGVQDESCIARLGAGAEPRDGDNWSIDTGAVEGQHAATCVSAPEGRDRFVVERDLRPVVWVLMASDILGAAQSLFDKSMNYLGERQQFGQPLSSYQALRHRAADDWVALEDMRAAIDYAAALFDSGGDPGAVLDAARIAKATASEFGTTVAENAIQYHGAVGFTWEFGLHFALKRIKRLSLTQGTASDHYRLIGSRYLQGIAKNSDTSGA
ncbi:acyl-CoA dehydrogenase family protein [Roseibium sp.]|uniref:acyl-CoA dehydrogenase family protein n=1 Tax=Roseibium sp. TaxID=1936156 RepID=UPI003A9827BE